MEGGCLGCPGTSTVNIENKRQKIKDAQHSSNLAPNGRWTEAHDLCEPVHVQMKLPTAKQTAPLWT